VVRRGSLGTLVTLGFSHVLTVSVVDPTHADWLFDCAAATDGSPAFSLRVGGLSAFHTAQHGAAVLRVEYRNPVVHVGAAWSVASSPSGVTFERPLLVPEAGLVV
jgi:hypothetical protein